MRLQWSRTARTHAAIILSAALTISLAAQPATVTHTAALTSAPVPLSKATQDKISRMTSLFDGRTLDGWIQAPLYSTTLSGSDLKDLPALAKKLAEKSDPVSAFLGARLGENVKAALAIYGPASTNTKEVTSRLLKNLNRLIVGSSLFDTTRFQRVRLRPDTEALRQKNPQGQELARLNRLLLEDAYPEELARSPATSWVVKDGAMASTGSGRGTLYTKGDYTRYRLIFTMRHVSGKPDHQPCVLVFCTRPPEGEKGLDALGGIQFQVPNGGHWDYRPGHNNGGTGFTNPTRTKYDNHEWHQVEILVNTREGTARMAVAQPVGTRAIENLDFKDPTAGKTGPIAWQMHNGGLFDEFKDVRIEVDPTEDKLITVE
jgi:hypothetical protein